MLGNTLLANTPVLGNTKSYNSATLDTLDTIDTLDIPCINSFISRKPIDNQETSLVSNLQDNTNSNNKNDSSVSGLLSHLNIDIKPIANIDSSISVPDTIEKELDSHNEDILDMSDDPENNNDSDNDNNSDGDGDCGNDGNDCNGDDPEINSDSDDGMDYKILDDLEVVVFED